MNEPLIHARPTAGLLDIFADTLPDDCAVLDLDGRAIACPPLADASGRRRFDASALEPWTPDNPRRYLLRFGGAAIPFGYSEIATVGNRDVTLNGQPIYLRGYIRGIVAHDHPNFTGGDRRAWHEKNVRQAKKYGFNLVRFHSTIPDDDFIAVADELGLLVHIEIGFAYQYDAAGKKTGLAVDNRAWTETILRYRNHPSVAIFCIGNEMHNAGANPIVRRLYDEAKRLAPNKLILDNAGWGEFDRETADIFAQHIAYFFPFKHHAGMFESDACWHLNGSVHGAPMRSVMKTPDGTAAWRRHATPTRPTLAHEAVHYIDIPDYDALNAKFDAFAARVGPDYLAEHGIQKPRYLAELPALIRAKGLEDRLADYRAASQLFKRQALKIYLERLRLSQLRGFEMLQLSDCLKYENKNGLLDFFDDDKHIDPAWMLDFNGPSALLADFSDETFYDDATANIGLHLSHFGAGANHTGRLVATLQRGDEPPATVLDVEAITTVHGPQQLGDLTLTFAPGTARHRLRVTFEAPGLTLANGWDFRVYARPALNYTPQNKAAPGPLRDWLEQHAAGAAEDGIVIRDRLDDAVFADLAAGRTVLLCYHRDNPDQPYYWPGALDRYKPCIWDRGHHLGGIARPAWLQQALAMDRYFDSHMQPLVEGGYKINLDHAPAPVEELISGVDKPVRDRMKGLIDGVKDFLPDDTLRNFCYLFAVRVGAGTLVVSTFSTARADRPSASAYYAALVNALPAIKPECSVAPEALRAYLQNARPAPEDVMNHFWELDNRPVEDSLFWEQAGVDLSRMK